MRILFLPHRIPYPPNKGDKIRTFHELLCLSSMGEVALATLYDQRGESRYRERLKRYCTYVETRYVSRKNILFSPLKILKSLRQPLSVAYFYEPFLQKWIDAIVEKFSPQLIFCFSSPMAQYVFSSSLIQSKKISPVLLMDFCDMDSHKWHQYSQTNSYPLKVLYALEYKRLFQYEKRIAQGFDGCIFVSRPEAELFSSAHGFSSNIYAIPNGVDFDFFSPSIGDKISSLSGNIYSPGTCSLVFVGAMDYYPNVEGIAWFAKEIFPYIKEKDSKFRMVIVGRNPVERIKDLHNGEDIIVTGEVKDVRPYYLMGDICVVPLRIARGIQNKVLEAMSMKLPVVLTSQAAKGIEGTDGRDFLLAHSAADFVNIILSLAKTPSLRKDIGNNARELVEKKYAWSHAMNMFKKLIYSKMENKA